MSRRQILLSLVLLLGLAAVFLPALAADDEEQIPRGPFGLTRLTTGDGQPVPKDSFFLNEDCGMCHPRQLEEVSGSIHSVAHTDPFYRAFAELARKEAGEEVYTYCSGCHSPAGVVTGMIPGMKEEELPPVGKAGVTCDVCHQISELTGTHGPWGEPGNASIVLTPGRVKFGSIEEIRRNPAHEGKRLDFYRSAEYCASCHTIIHPTNGLRIEHTYEEWKSSVYAEKGIVCQDCHMRSVEDATKVAETLEPVVVKGPAVMGGPDREIHPHYFVGGNSNVHLLGGDEEHAEMARARLRSAATIEVDAPEKAAAGGSCVVRIVITNVGAGHNLPTSLTELREMWVEIRLARPDGQVVHVIGEVGPEEEIPEGLIRFGAHLLDEKGEVTYRPWEAVKFDWQRSIPPKGKVEEEVSIPLPADLRGEFTVSARLFYRSAPPHVVKEVMGEDAFIPEIVEMAVGEDVLLVE